MTRAENKTAGRGQHRLKRLQRPNSNVTGMGEARTLRGTVRAALVRSPAVRHSPPDRTPGSGIRVVRSGSFGLLLS